MKWITWCPYCESAFDLPEDEIEDIVKDYNEEKLNGGESDVAIQEKA